MSEERSSLADWLRAVEALQPQSEEHLQVIARLMGLRMKSVARAAATSRKRTSAPEPAPEIGTAAPEKPAPESKPRRRIDSVLTPGNASRNAPPAWLTSVRFLETTEPAHLHPVLPLEPLFPGRTSRAILSGALATPSASGQLNLAKVIEMLTRAELIESVPRLPVPTLVRGVQLLIDRSESMQPFATDQAAVRAVIARVVGRDRTQVLYFDGSPLWGAGIGPKDEWPEYDPPAPGTPVVALTDLGIAQPPGLAGIAGPSDWRTLAAILARADCPLLALVPYPPRRWPPLAKCLTIIQWDRATTAAVVRRAIRGGLRVSRAL